MGPAADLAAGPRRVGIFGGSFDPPHIGHLAVARDVADALDLTVVLWVPAAQSPLKRGEPQASDEHRLEMVRSVIGADPRFQVSDVELRRGGRSYTVDTLRALRGVTAGAEDDFFLILGIDQYRDFPRWREPDAIREMATLAVMDRAGDRWGDELDVAVDLRTGRDAGEGVVRVPVGRVDVSSTEVRRRVAAGEDIDGLVTDGVRDIIQRERLYRTGSAGRG